MGEKLTQGFYTACAGPTLYQLVTEPKYHDGIYFTKLELAVKR